MVNGASEGSASHSGILDGPTVSENRAPKSPVFAHPSEAEFAAILDFYQITWLYEPHSFPLRHDESGRVVERFTPDFYLPDFDLYIELTTLKQSLVTKKNRKLRRLREVYPHLRVKLLYKRDYRNLLLKFGLPLETAEAPAAGATTLRTIDEEDPPSSTTQMIRE